jgi:hypothetical protein
MKRGPEPLAEHNIIDTSDIDDARQAMSKTYLPLQLHARPGSARLNMRLNAITVGRATIGYVRFSTDIRIVTEEAANYHLNIPLSGRSRSCAGNRDEVVSAPGSAVVYVPGEPVELCWTSGIQQRCLMLGKVTLERELTYLLGRELRKPPSSQRRGIFGALRRPPAYRPCVSSTMRHNASPACSITRSPLSGSSRS